MDHAWRKLFPYLVVSLFVGAVAWALSFGTLPPADFTFCNGTEIETIDPARVTGQPEGRIISAVFDALYRTNPKTGEPMPGLCTTLDVTKDYKHFVFPLRDDARWTDGTPLTSKDFVWSFRRFLHPETMSKYAYLMYYVVGARNYNGMKVKLGDPVEVELADRPKPWQFPSGTIVRGTLKSVEGQKPGEPTTDKEGFLASSKETIYVVQEADGKEHRFWRRSPDLEAPKDTTVCLYVLPDFEKTVRVKATNPTTLEVELNNPTPFFPKLMAFYPLSPVNQACIERHGTPLWTKPENIVSSGPYKLEFRRIRDRIRLRKNPTFWNAKEVKLETIDALAVSSDATMLNLYLDGKADWITTVPSVVIPDLKHRKDYLSRPILTTYFYRLNVTKPPLDDKRVRQALNMAIDKQEIVEYVTKAGQVPALSFVPPGLAGYENPPKCGKFDPEGARKLLAEAGYPGGKGFPTIEVLYNTAEGHALIAQKIQDHWRKHLGIDLKLANQEWSVFLASTHSMEYQVARAAWGADYPDPNTFLDMWVKDGENNETGWHSDAYDQLIRDAEAETDPKKRMEIFYKAEAILMDELPIIPFYFYVKSDMVRTYVKGFYPNVLDIHPLEALEIDPKEREEVLRSRE
jgi:oligopeptide transport system substrate-binding protein